MKKAKRLNVKELLQQSIERSYSKGDTLLGCAHRDLIGITLGVQKGVPR